MEQVDFNMGAAWDKVDAMIDGAVRLLPNLLIAVVVFITIVLLARLARSVVRRTFAQSGRVSLGRVLASLIFWAGVGLAFAIATTIIVPSIRPGDLIAGLGIGSVAIGFAFKDILQNLLAGILILVRQPFVVGDQIEVNGHEGTVDEIQTRATLLKTYNGERVVIPNSDIYTDAVTVRSAFDIRRSQYDIGIGYGDSIDDARETIFAALKNVPGVEQDPAPQVLTWDLAASWVTLRARWWTNATQNNLVEVKAQVLQAMKNALDDAGIDMPYDTKVHLFHDQTDELDGDRSKQREGWPQKPGEQAPRSAREVANNRTGDSDKLSASS